ncbi:MAG: hypothetical protein N2049_02275 [Anaerolineales bacterium]|nr:hypothetical protein [Anaerolineales bacterium]MCX7608033.1 hypothetical protein [Anaerolineales bacterium]MDW8227501.1 hypothetical protein [Anaerolineales bacterium]
MNDSENLSLDAWKDFSLSQADLDFINNYLFEVETPLTEAELAPLVVEQRLQREREERLAHRQAGRRIYFPKETYHVGEKIVFPSLGWKKAEVVHVRPGSNPDLGDFDVIEVLFEDGTSKRFAARLAEHKLNQLPKETVEEKPIRVEQILKLFGDKIEEGIRLGLQKADGLVRIAGRWFPRALLIDVNTGHLNLAEAILDEKQGGPLPTSALIEQIELPAGVNPKLLEFSMNYALQEDERFDEVGPAGQVWWYLRRMEPEDVQQPPPWLRYTDIPYDRSVLTQEMLAFEASLDDELSPLLSAGNAPAVSEVTIVLTYPHWRAGTLPISARTRGLFPTAYESPRVLFRVVDAHTKEETTAWVVRPHGYVVGLSTLYKKYGLFPGSLITLRRGKPGQVVVEAKLRRPVRDWVRTVLVGSDGELVFATVKHNLGFEFNERMLLVVPDVAGVDEAREKITRQRLPMEKLVETVMRDLSRLNVQGHVHASELYAALNVIRRCPPGLLLALLTQNPNYRHIGDLYFRIGEAEEAYE